MHLTTQILLGFIVISFVLSITLDSLTQNFSITSVVGYLFGLLVYFLVLLDQSCVVEGPCTVWGWVKVLISIFIFILLIVFKILAIVTASKEKKNEKAKKDAGA